jgi:hypothetical protein
MVSGMLEANTSSVSADSVAIPESEGFASGFTPETGEFDYKPIAILGPVSVFTGICAASGLITVAGVLVGMAGVLLACVAIWQIRRSEGELSGGWIAKTGLAVSLAFTLVGGAWHSYVYATEVPEGYDRVSFSWLSNQGFVADADGARPTEEVAKLDKKKIYIKGYMYPGRQRNGLTEFVLCKDNGDCCFGGQPKPTDMIAVKMQPGMTVDLLEQQLVGVAGIFHAQTVTKSGDLTSVYMLEGTHFR